MLPFLSQLQRLNWANRITLLRIGAILPIWVFLQFPNRLTCWLAGILFMVAAASDFLDGYLARRDGQVTTLGKFLDPLADKLLICCVLIEMTGMGWVPAWVTIIIVMRELAVTGLRAVAADNGVIISADRYGKLKTLMQLFALAPLIVHYPLFGLPLDTIGIFILYIAVILTVISGINYFYRFYYDWSLAQRSGAKLADQTVEK